jgi:hypothetical protein
MRRITFMDMRTAPRDGTAIQVKHGAVQHGADQDVVLAR